MLHQQIKIQATAGSTGHSMKLLSAYQLNNQILALIESSGGLSGGESICHLQLKFRVKTGTLRKLPVKVYIVNSRERRTFNSSKYYGLGAENAGEFIPLQSPHDFQKLVLGGTCLYEETQEV